MKLCVCIAWHSLTNYARAMQKGGEVEEVSHDVTKGTLNAKISVMSIVDCVNVLTEETDENLRLQITFCDSDERKELVCPYSMLNSNDIYKFLEKEGVVFSESGAGKKAFRNELLLQRRKAPKRSCLNAPQGFFWYEGKLFCKLGHKIFSSEDENLTCMPNKKELRLRQSTEESFERALNFVFVDKMVSPMLLLYVGFSVWNEFLAEIGHPQRFVLYVTGETGTMKSTLCREVVKIFEEKTEMTLSSTYAALQQEFQRYRAVPVLLDDYNESDFRKIKREKGEKLAEFIQMYADRETLCKSQNNKVLRLSIDSGLIVTAEEPLQNPSTMNRCIVVTPCDVNVSLLSKLQQYNSGNAIFSELLQRMVQYMLKKYGSIKERGQELYIYACKEAKRFEEYRQVPGYARVMESYRISIMVLRLWRNFLYTEGVKKEDVKEIVEEMEAALEDSVEYTFSLLNTKDNSLEIIQVVCLEIMEYIRKSKIIDDDRKFNKHPEKYSGLLDEDKVFIRGDEMSDIVSMKLRRGVSKKEISAALYQYGLVTKRNGRYSRKIPHSESNQRYYCLDYKELEELYREVHPDMSLGQWEG